PETRIQYDTLDLRYDPNAESRPWELWIDGERELSATNPSDALEAWAARSELGDRYTGTDGKPNHERRPDKYVRKEGLATPAMDLDTVPSSRVQTALWGALKTSDDPCILREFCADTGIEYADARRAVSLFATHDLVEWDVSPNLLWLTSKGKEVNYPDWFDIPSNAIQLPENTTVRVGIDETGNFTSK